MNQISPTLLNLAIGAIEPMTRKPPEAPPMMGKVPPLVLWGDPVLERFTKPVEKFGTRNLLGLIADLRTRLATLKGHALAAPQIGDNRAVAYIALREDTKPEFVMINPKITSRKGKARMMEGCLSIPGFTHTIDRYEQVTVYYQDENGNKLHRTAKGLLAQVIQHECDHLEGKTIMTYVKDRPARRQAKRLMEEARR